MDEQPTLFDAGQLRPAPCLDRRRSRPTPAPIGSGPEGRTCRDCAHYCVVDYHDRTYRKCGLMRALWTHGPGTDIRARWAACREFEEDPGGPTDGRTSDGL